LPEKPKNSGQNPVINGRSQYQTLWSGQKRPLRGSTPIGPDYTARTNRTGQERKQKTPENPPESQKPGVSIKQLPPTPGLPIDPAAKNDAPNPQNNPETLLPSLLFAPYYYLSTN
jgi:hypothetical protein